MRTYLCRCKHCGKLYSYQASGDGCFSKFNDENYCSDCQKVIVEALESYLPKSQTIIRQIKEIEYKDIKNHVHTFKDLKRKYSEGTLSIVAYVPLPFKFVDIYNLNGYRYYVCWDDDVEKKSYFADYEYDGAKNEFTQLYKHLNSHDGYTKGCGRPLFSFKAEDIPVRKMEPLGKLYWFDVATDFKKK